MADSTMPPDDQTQQQSAFGTPNPRINKPDMFMIAALWMEMSALAERPDAYGLISWQPNLDSQDHNVQEDQDSRHEPMTKGGMPLRKESGRENTPEHKALSKCGAVFVLQNDRALSVDCSRGGVHAAVRALNKFGHERVKGCQVYLSRRPCSHCAKLLVQCEVLKVFYLPIEPEWADQDDIRRVDNIFKSSSSGLSIFIPRVRDFVINNVKTQGSPFRDHSIINENEIKEKKRELESKYWNDEWLTNASKFGLPAFCDDLKEETMKDMSNLLEWIARVTYGHVPEGVRFAEIDPETKQAKPDKSATECEGDANGSGGEVINVPSLPIPSVECWQEHAKHMCRMANMLSQRSDDPTRRVGCVLMLDNEVVALGWNGFPAKVLFGEFPRASRNSSHYVIHAEQNALLTRNTINIKDESSILFSSKIPAPECVPMLIAAGVRHIVIPHEPSDSPDNSTGSFFEALMINSNKLTGYWPKEELRQRPRPPQL